MTTSTRKKNRHSQDEDSRARNKARCHAYYEAHKEEINARSRAYYHAHKQDIQPLLRRGQLKRLYGISPADYDALLAAQGGVCAICGKRSKKTLCVDHCHATGTIRGLLCGKCNTGFGCYDDDQAAMIAALAYLGGGDRDCVGAAAQRALAARAALPPGRARMIIEIKPRRRNRFEAAPLGRSAAIGGITRGRTALPTHSKRVRPNAGAMSIADAPPGGGTRPMWDALAAELQREADDGAGNKAGILQLIARTLAAKALDGDLGAIREIFDRMAAS
jgi:hypothetical protein